ncbi:G1 family glutamic endopeptidase [Bosea sp. RAF48]|uniref:G1 family glutamic endopeptidase n=1 Tax=Bosea sp. RAF48 TaxID=3237480 RepID=UPI003F9117C6
MASRSPHGTTKPRPRNGAIAPYPLPPETFNPAHASDEDLQRFGLPTPAEFRGNPAAAAFRLAFLHPRPNAPPLQFLSVLKAADVAPPTGIVRVAAQASWPMQKSMNWSGGYVTPRDGRSLVSVMANWTVPAVSAPPGGTEPEYQSSTWIGLDGQKLYLDSSLPQIGTRQRWLTGPAPHAEYLSWFQWWARGQDLPIQELALPIDPYDEISALVTVLDETTVRCNLKNVSKGIILQAFDASAPAGLRISGASAEWIMERPSPMGSDGWEPYAFPIYTPFAFTRCVAESAEPEKPDLWEHDLDSTRLIRMYEIDRNPTSVRTISTARRILEPPQRLELTRVAP